ncbi:Arp7 protein [Candida orthopsilosis Co 90-125]|uniref:Arp7 protein n=1 Tax=Candida orthopsilosis (strain 90-125) TaxID=1136231 RepID=H8X0G9_CANO9|nr:Arp7 protein [Candida orthopsilosis Co 90-125]CCG22681.1 Arp7 protein [Candida orthopsilosis Co 90-125]
MAYTAPAVVIDNGSYTTKAGFASDDLPSLVFNSNYIVDNVTNDVIVGDDEMDNYSQSAVSTLLEDGLIYNFDNIVHNWRYVYNNIDNHNSINSNEFPLAMTEQSWNTMKAKVKTCQIVFEEFEVPLFSLIKNPLSQLYRCGKSTGLVIDVGSSVASVTPILDGVIQDKCTFHSKYAGDFLNLHILNYLEGKVQSVDELLPASFRTASESFKSYYMSTHVLQEYKNLSLNYQVSNLEVYDHKFLNVSDQRNYLENLFDPTLNKLPNINLPEPSLDVPSSQGLTNLVYMAIRGLEASLLPHGDDPSSQSQNRFARFMEIFKQILSNVLITGGTSLASELSDHVINDIKALMQKYFPTYPFSYHVQQIRPTQNNDNSDIWDKQFGSWLGACNLASMLNENDENSSSAKIALDNWFVSKADYEELGEDLILEKLK